VDHTGRFRPGTIERGGTAIGKVAMVRTRTIAILAAAGFLSFAAGFCAQILYGDIADGSFVIVTGARVSH
jgi:hypothetical protein